MVSDIFEAPLRREGGGEWPGLDRMLYFARRGVTSGNWPTKSPCLNTRVRPQPRPYLSAQSKGLAIENMVPKAQLA